MQYTLIPIYPQPWYRAVLPWDEYLTVCHLLRGQGKHQLMGLINSQMRQTGDGNAYLHLQHAEFTQVNDLVRHIAQTPKRHIQPEASS